MNREKRKEVEHLLSLLYSFWYFLIMRNLDKSEVFFYLLGAFILGVVAGSFWTAPIPGILTLCVVGLGVLAISSYHKTFGQSGDGIKRRKLGFFVGCLILLFAFGIFRFNQFNSSRKNIAEFSDRIVGGKSLVSLYRGYINSVPEVSGGKMKFVFRAKSVVAGSREVIVDDDVLISSNIAKIGFGDKVMLQGGLLSPQNIDDFDYAGYLKKEGISYTMSYPEIKGDEKLSLDLLERVRLIIYKKIFQSRLAFENAINRSILEPESSYINGILLGTKQNIPKDLKEAFSITGTSHILAISGYNITIISWAIMNYILLHFMKRRNAFWATAAIIVAFTIMTGASASVVRASIMGLVLLFAQGYGRLYDPKNSLLLAGSAMVFFNPFLLKFDIGFQLSFLAVIGLAFLYPSLMYVFRKLPNPSGLKDTLLATLSAQIVVAPLLAYHFHTFSLISLLANILILPFLPLVMLLGFASGFSGIILHWLGQVVGYSAWAISKYQISVVERLSSLPGSSVNVDVSISILIVIYILIFGLIWKLHDSVKTG